MPDIFRVVMVLADGEDFSLRNPSDEIPYQRHDPQVDRRDEHKSSSLLEEVKKHREEVRKHRHKTPNANREAQNQPYRSFMWVRHTNPDGVLIFENMSSPLPS